MFKKGDRVRVLGRDQHFVSDMAYTVGETGVIVREVESGYESAAVRMDSDGQSWGFMANNLEHVTKTVFDELKEEIRDDKSKAEKC